MREAINFQNDAMECVRMAEQAQGPEEKSVLVSLARAWVLLGEQLQHLHDGNGAERQPGALN